ncbi:hypothetical protein GCM10010207_29960 [Streptomyces atratus]|uniref:hypothetical protein n=1 Tax=Streptomyces atratus TaxID=1893 RepID=UPI0019CE9156|nr:hypothetical protein GCM10010207_29960 [Streptomyces atratus]
MRFSGIVRDVPRTVRLLAFGSFLNGVVSFTFVYLFIYLTGPRGLTGPQAGVIAGVGGIGQVPAPPIGGALCAAAPGLLWPACAVLAGGAGGGGAGGAAAARAGARGSSRTGTRTAGAARLTGWSCAPGDRARPSGETGWLRRRLAG